MKRLLWLCALACLLPTTLFSQDGVYQHGMVIRMRMADCPGPQRGVMAMLAGNNIAPQDVEQCPVYTLVTDQIVYVISGKESGQIIPLAERTDFRLKRNELLIRVDDARRETHFVVKEMSLRLEWERSQQCTAGETESPSVRSSVHPPVVYPMH